jgi:hypothetical protein
MKSKTWREAPDDKKPDYIIGVDISSEKYTKSIACVVKTTSDGLYVSSYKIETIEGPEAIDKIIECIASAYDNSLIIKERP